MTVLNRGMAVLSWGHRGTKMGHAGTKVDVRAVSQDLLTALLCAMINQKGEVASYLIQQDPDPGTEMPVWSWKCSRMTCRTSLPTCYGLYGTHMLIQYPHASLPSSSLPFSSTLPSISSSSLPPPPLKISGLLEIADSNGDFPLHFAVVEPLPDMVETLLLQGADPLMVNQ
eukprot:958526-Rhodomonas_salina.1